MPPDNKEKTYKFDLLFLKRFYRLQGVFFPALLSTNAGVFLGLLLLSGIEQFLAYEVGLLSGAFYKVLGEKDLAGFRSCCIRSLLVILAMVAARAARTFSGRTLGVGWRRELCQHLQRLYLAARRYYRLLALEPSQARLDNPDQRITADCASIARTYSEIIGQLVVVPFTAVYYAWQAYSRAGWLGPTAMLGYFLVSTALNKALMAPVVRLTASQERAEGDFRFRQVRVRTHAEPLAFSGCEAAELAGLQLQLAKLCGIQQRLATWNLPVDLSVQLFNYLGAVVSYLVIAVPIFSGYYDSLTPGELAQLLSETAFVCMYLVFQFSQLVNLTSTVAGLAGSTHRVSELLERLLQYKQEEEELHEVVGAGEQDGEQDGAESDASSSCGLLPSDQDHQKVEGSPPPSPAPLLSLTGLSYRAPGPDSPLLVADLSLQLSSPASLLVMGPSGCGKTGLLRVVAGLWPHQGSLARARPALFLPQTPWWGAGGLRDQVSYPEPADTADQARVDTALSTCHLASLAPRPGTDCYSLSPGEQQRLAWARLLYHAPALAFLDEATSAVSEELEQELYSAARSLGVSVVSVGHRASLRRLHSHLLQLASPPAPPALSCLQHS